MRHTVALALVSVIAVSADSQGAETTPTGTLRFAETEFGRSLDATLGGISVESRAALNRFPLTVQVRFRLEPRSYRFRSVIAAATAGDTAIWQVYHDARKTLTLEGLWQGDVHLRTDARTTDGKWHDLALVLTDSEVQIHLDGTQLARRKVAWKLPARKAELLWIGQSPDGVSGLDGWVDDLLISPGRPPLRNVWKPDGKELVWLDFEESESEYLARWTPLRSTRADAEPWEQETDADWADDRFQSMQRGSFFACSTKLPGRYTGTKNLVIRVRGHELTPANGRHAGMTVLFDTERCVTSAVVAESRLTIFPRRFGILQMPELRGRELSYNDARQAWRLPGDTPGESTPVPADAIRYSGYHRHRWAPLVKYTVFSSDFQETWGPVLWDEDSEGRQLDTVSRLLQIGQKTPLKRDVLVTLAEVDADATGIVSDRLVHLKHGEDVVEFRLASPREEARLQRHAHRIELLIPSGTSSIQLIQLTGKRDLSIPADRIFDVEPKENWQGFNEWFELLVTSDRRNWEQPLRPKVRRRKVEGLPYEIDSYHPEFSPRVDSPYSSLFFVTGFDFFESGTRAAVCTAHGDVWIIDELDGDEVAWNRFATGLYQPLGLRIVDDKVIVLGRDQLTRLHDHNNDLEADYYENFNNDLVITGTPHAFATCLETDPDGNFYFFKCGKSPPHGGRLLKLSPDGGKLEVFASGFRHPIGLGASPQGLITTADNQGNWIPASGIHVVDRGTFRGFMPEVHRPDQPDTFDQPMCWMPVSFDNSSGGQTWVPDNRWGPFKDQMLHLSWGRCTLNLVLTEQVDGVWQGGAVAFPGLKFDSGPIVARFNPKDGHLYVCGLDGWQTAAAKDGCLQRVRYTGGDIFMPKSLNAYADGLRIEFTEPVDSRIAAEPSNYEISQWQYRWTSAYGSPEYSIRNPNRIGHDTVTISNVTVADDGRSVFLRMPDIAPVMQMEIRMNLAPAGGERTERTIYNTIHRLRPADSE